MFQSLTASALPSLLQQADSLDLSEGAMIGTVLLSLVALGAAFVHWLMPDAPISVAKIRRGVAPDAPRRTAPRSQRKLGAQQTAQRAPSAPPPSSRRRRLIVLYDVTPGQTPYEYNVGDSAGTRGASPQFGRAR